MSRFLATALTNSLLRRPTISKYLRSSVRVMSAQRIETKKLPLVERNLGVSDDYHGVQLKDPYRVLEDADHETTKDFVSRINDLSRPVLDAAPLRPKIDEKIHDLWDYRKVSGLNEHNGKLFYWVNEGTQNQDVLFESNFDRTEIKPFLNVNEMAEDGSLSVSSIRFSKPDEDKILAYGLSKNGSDEVTVQFKAQTGETLPDVLKGVKHSCLTWFGNSKLLYSKYQSENGSAAPSDGKICTSELKNHTVYCHVLGTDQSEDKIVFERPEHPSQHVHAESTEKGDFCLFTVTRGCDPTNLLYVQEVRDDRLVGHRRPIVDDFKYKIEYVANIGPKFFFLTNMDGANRFKIVTCDVSQETIEFTDFIDEPERGSTIKFGHLMSEGLLVGKSVETKASVTLHDIETGRQIMDNLMTGFETIDSMRGKPENNFFYLGKSTFTRPTSLWRVTIENGAAAWELFDASGSEEHNYDDSIDVKDGYATSADGTKVHYFILQRKDSVKKRDRSRPALVYGYGGFSISLEPGYSVTRLMFIKHFDGVHVMANLRGGHEYGEEWHVEGMLSKKENVFNDMIAVVNDVVEEGYSKHSRVTIQGGSNGGLLVAACAQRAPLSIGAVICQVGVLDMIRYPQFTVGRAWTTEFGDPDEEEAFKYLMRYSPLHKLADIDPTSHPAMLVLTADHDDRVVPGHSLKYLAELYHQAQRVEKCRLLLGRIEENAGHGAGKSTKQRINENVDIFTFLAQVHGLEWIE